MKTLEITFLDDRTNNPFIVNIDILGFQKLGFSLFGIPRDKIALAASLDNSTSQGVYFLVNTTENRTEKRYLYIGQTTEGIRRLNNHKLTKAEWNMAYMFLGPKKTLPLQTINELEALEINKYKDNEAFNLINIKPNKDDPTNETKNIAKVIEEVLTFFGYGAEESLRIYREAHKDNDKVVLPTIEIKSEGTYYLKRKKGNVDAKMVIENGKYKILSGSTYIINYTKSFPSNCLKIRKELEANDVMKNGIFASDYSFDSISAAAAQVLGTSADGHREWKLESGNTEALAAINGNQQVNLKLGNKGHTVDEDLNLAYKTFVSFDFNGRHQQVESGKDFLVKVCEIIFEENKTTFENMARNDFSLAGSKTPFITYKKNLLTAPKEIKNIGIYIETNRSATDIVKTIRKLFDTFGIKHTNLVFYIV